MAKPNSKIIQLKDDIDEFTNQLLRENISNGFVDRLNELKDNLENQASEWYHLDIYTILSPTLILDELRVNYRKRYWWIGYIEVVRNFLVLLPILLTWYALSEASDAYSQAVYNDNTLGAIPFLVQWEQGFSGILPTWLYFSEVAQLAAIILIAIVIMTILVHFENNILLDAAEKKAVQLASDFENLLLRIAKVLTQRTDPNTLSQSLLNNIKDYTDKFQEQAENLQDLLNAEQDRLEKINDFRLQEIQEFSGVSKDLIATTGQLANFTTGTQQAFDDLQQLLSSMADEIQAIPTLQENLDRTLKALVGQIGGFELVMKTLVHQLENGFTDTSHSLHVELTNLENTVRQVAGNQNILVQAINDITKIVNNERDDDINTVQHLETLIDKLEKTSRNYDTYSKQFAEIFSNSADELRSLNENIKDFTKTIKSSSISSAPSSDPGMNNLIKELQSLNSALRKNRLLNFLGNK